MDYLNFMVNFIENISKIKKWLILLMIFLAMTGLYIYNAKDYVIIRFNELGAFIASELLP